MSSFYDLASLVMIPSGKKAGKVYSQKPLSTDGQLDFTRASTATRIGSDGKIEKTRTNLLTYSNDFSNADWTPTNVTLTSGQSGYDSSSNAWRIEATTTNVTNIFQSESISANTPVTLSVYAKSGNVNFLKLIVLCTGSNSIATYNLSDGSTTNKVRHITVKMELIGNGWYRCSLTGAPTTDITGFRIEVRSDANNGSADAGSYIFIQNAQAEIGLVATNVITTTSAAVSVGSVDNMPRLNYTLGSATSCPSLLLEPQRTNLIPQSEYFGGWPTAGSFTLTNNYAESIEGVSNAARFQTTSSARGVIYYSISVSPSVTYTISVFVKSVSGTNKIRIGADNGCSNPQGAETFDVTSNWTRIEKTLTSTQTGWNVFFDNVASGDACTGTYLDTDILIYGFQAEAGSYATSYIPTFGATVTRVVDACSKTSISGLIGQTEGTLFFECTNKALLSFARYFGISDGTTSNRIDIYHHTSDRLAIYVATSGTAQVNVQNVDLPSSGSFKFALAYANNDYVWYLNGSQIGTDTSASVPLCDTANIGTESLGTAAGGNNPFKKTLLFKTRLSNTQLSELTSIDS